MITVLILRFNPKASAPVDILEQDAPTINLPLDVMSLNSLQLSLVQRLLKNSMVIMDVH